MKNLKEKTLTVFDLLIDSIKCDDVDLSIKLIEKLSLAEISKTGNMTPGFYQSLNPLQLAVRLGRLKIVEKLLIKKPIWIEELLSEDKNILFFAPNAETAEFLLNKNPNLINILNSNGSSILHNLANGYYLSGEGPKLITYLASKMPQYSIDAKNTSGNTALDLAAKNCNAQSTGSYQQHLEEILLISSPVVIKDALSKLNTYEHQSLLYVMRKIIDSLNKQINDNSEDAEAYLKKANLLSNLGKNHHEEAIKCYQESMRIYCYYDKIANKDIIADERCVTDSGINIKSLTLGIEYIDQTSYEIKNIIGENAT